MPQVTVVSNTQFVMYASVCPDFQLAHQAVIASQHQNRLGLQALFRDSMNQQSQFPLTEKAGKDLVYTRGVKYSHYSRPKLFISLGLAS